MIVIEEDKDLLKANIYAELTLNDYRELEKAITAKLKKRRKLNLLLDLRNMSGFTVDVAWEDIKFTRSHPHDFARIGVLSSDQWTGWLGWLGTAFTDAEVQTFTDPEPALAWAQGR
jgi:hypothetical protein